MASTSTDNNVFLTSPDDWEAWELQFQGQAGSKRLWDQILGTKEFLIEPIAPELTSFQHPVATGSQSGSNGEPEANIPLSFATLSGKNQKAFQFAYTVYTEEEKRYVAQIASIDKVKEWIRKTVSPNYQRTCCRPIESIKDWYEKLKEHAGISEYEAETETREKYKRATKPISKPKDIPSWTTAWEQAMAAAQEKGLSAAMNPIEWFDDFMMAVRPVMPNWAESYRIMKKSEVRNKSLTYRTLANDFREAARLLTNAFTCSPTKVAKGSFGPVFADQDGEAERLLANAPNPTKVGNPTKVVLGSFGPAFAGQDQCAGMDTSKQGVETQGGSWKGRRVGKRKQPEEKHSSGKTVCRGCSQRHPYQKCYYLFNENVPQWFRERSEVHQAVNQALKDDPTLAEEVKRLKKRKETPHQYPQD